MSISPGKRLSAVTPHDSNSNAYRALYIGGAGNVAVVAVDDTSAVTLVGVPAGTVLPIATSKVMSTNTTATSIVGIR